MSKLERMEVKDREHVRAILTEYPLAEDGLESLVKEMPHRLGLIRAADRVAMFERGLAELRAVRGARP
jgi:hypothetical protein